MDNGNEKKLIEKRFEKLDPMPIPLDSMNIDVPEDFDPGYDLQTKCDCGNEVWEPGDLVLGHSTITGEKFTMKANLCTLCKSPQMWISRQYLKELKKQEGANKSIPQCEA